MTDGLKDAHRAAIIATIAANERVERAVLFGSRATGTNTVSSDVDIALFGDRLTLTDQARLAVALDEIPMAQSVDLVLYDSIDNPTLLEHIRRHGVELCARPRKRASKLSTLPGGTTHPRGLPPVDSIHWPLAPARDLFKLTYGRALAAPDRRPGNVPVYGTNGRCGSHDTALFEGPGVVLGRKGQGPLGVEWSDGPYWVIDTAYTLTPLRRDVHLKFAYYLLKFIGLNHLKDGTSNPTLSRETFGVQALPLPPLPFQRAIAHILGTLDDKIELNRRMNATLEAMARALFRSWFVDFDPVRAKMEGRDTGLPKDIADLFPDRLVEKSELGEVPEGWAQESLSEHFEAVKGVSYKGSGLGDNGVPLHNLNSVKKRGGYRCEGIKFYSGDYADRHVVHPGDVIVANTDLGRERLLIGYAAIVPRLFGDSGIVSHHLYRVRTRPSGRLSTAFLYALLNSSQMHDVVVGYANGTTVTMLPIDALQTPTVVVPPRSLLEAFDALALLLEHRREQTVTESQTLGAFRDTLLPKLVSGELRITAQVCRRDNRPASVETHEA